MAVNREPVLKRCKSLGISPMVMGIAKETKDIQAIDKIRKTYEGQDDAALLDVRVLEVKEKLGDG